MAYDKYRFGQSRPRRIAEGGRIAASHSNMYDVWLVAVYVRQQQGEKSMSSGDLALFLIGDILIIAICIFFATRGGKGGV